MKKVLLYNIWYSDGIPPRWWMNFKNYHKNYFDMNDGLKEYSATLELENGCRWIEFESDEHATWYILRWT